jgi:hypothetical protein
LRGKILGRYAHILELANRGADRIYLNETRCKFDNMAFEADNGRSAKRLGLIADSAEYLLTRIVDERGEFWNFPLYRPLERGGKTANGSQ